MVWPNRGAFGAIGGYGLNVLKLLQESYRCCRYAPAAGSTGLRRQARQAQAPSPVFFIEAPGRPVFFSPPDTRGWRARGRCRRRFNIRISLRKCGSASRRATRTSLKCPGSFAVVFFRFAHSRKRNCCAGPRFPGTVLIGGSRSEVAFASPPGLPSFLTASPARNCGQASTAAPSASSWRAAHIGHQAEPRRRPSAWEERSSPARGRRIRLHHQTPHDDAPRLSRT